MQLRLTWVHRVLSLSNLALLQKTLPYPLDVVAINPRERLLTTERFYSSSQTALEGRLGITLPRLFQFLLLCIKMLIPG